MSDVKWIKICTDIFDDEKILLIESMPDSDTVITIWFKLLCLAGKQNNSGVFLLNDRIPYTDEMLATIFRRTINTVRMALDVFERFGMVERANGVVTIPNWEKHQSLDSFEKKKEYNRQYMAKKREAQKALISGKTTSSATVVPLLNNSSRTDIDIELDKDIDIDNNIYVCSEEVTNPAVEIKTRKRTKYSEEFETFWKAYPKQVEKTTAYKCFNARIKQDKVTPEFLIECAKIYAKKTIRTDKKYKKHPATYLSANRPYEDDDPNLPENRKYLDDRELKDGEDLFPEEHFEVANDWDENPFAMYGD